MILYSAGCILFLANYVESTHLKCLEECGAAWFIESSSENLSVDTFINKTVREDYQMLTWRWYDGQGSGQWSVYLQSWPKQRMRVGGMRYLEEKKELDAHLKWKLMNDSLTWLSDSKVVPRQDWDITICDADLRLGYKESSSSGSGWVFRLGEFELMGGTSGRRETKKAEGDAGAGVISRHKRSPQFEAFADNPGTTWEKFKGYFKELLNQECLTPTGEGDERRWTTRLTDWLLGFLQRLLS